MRCRRTSCAAMRWLNCVAAVQRLHRPPPGADLDALVARTDAAWTRIKFDELLAQQLALRAARDRRAARAAPALTGPTALTQSLRAQLPFALTAAQQRVWLEVERDLAAARPMHRLLQGDVGSGKTVVAALAAARAIECGYQAALMAPTELLAEQHFARIAPWLAPLGVRSSGCLAAECAPAKRAAQGGGRPVARRARRRHARPDPGRCRLCEARAGDRRRAASLRRCAAAGAARRPQRGRAGPAAASADAVGHADSAHAGDELSGGSGCLGRSTNCRPAGARS
jgi:hypothetical protein